MFEVISQLQFVERPPYNVTFNSTSETIAINCTATAASGLPVNTQWSINRYHKKQLGCDEESYGKSISVFSNGTLVIPNADRCDIGVYNCSAQHDGETISTSARIVSLYRGIYIQLFTRIETTIELAICNFSVDTSWMLTSDSCGGFRQSTYDKSVRYAVSLSDGWDKSKIYDCPVGYHWASTDEGRKIFKSNPNKSGIHVYRAQCQWSGYVWEGKNRYYFRFRDSASTNAYKHSGNHDEYQIQIGGATTQFAGIVCIKD